MRIIQVTPSYLPAVRYGGPMFAIHGLSRALVELGHSVAVHTTHIDGAGTLDMATGCAHDMDGVSVHYHPVPAGVPLARRLYYSPSLLEALGRAVPGNDVVHAHSLFLHPVSAAARMAAMHEVPFVIAPRGMLVPSLFAERSALAKKLWLTVTGRRMLTSAAAIHVTSAVEARDVAAFGLSLPPTLLVPNGLEPPAVPDLERRARRVLYLGRLSWKKGLHALIAAMVHVADAELHLVGNDDEGISDDLMRTASALGIGERIVLRDPVDATGRWHEFAKASVFVLPSMSENFANTVLEAMAMECPVVLTRAVGLADAVRAAGAGTVSEPESPELAAHINAILRDSARARDMGTRGRAHVLESFRWPQVARQMVAGYESLATSIERDAA